MHKKDLSEYVHPGVPVVEAPCEAEAQCAELCKAGKVFCCLLLVVFGRFLSSTRCGLRERRTWMHSP